MAGSKLKNCEYMKNNTIQKITPNNWTPKRLGDLFDIKRGGSPRPIDQFITDREDGLNWLKIGDIRPGAKFISSTSSKILKDGLKKTTLVKPGDFILSNSMSFGRPYIMKIEACIHDGWLTFQNIKNSLVFRDFLYFLLLHPKTQNTFKIISAGSGVQNLKKETVANVVLDFPPLSEQKRIALILETWDQTIEKLEEKIETKENIKKGLMQNLLTGKVRLTGFKDKWKLIKLGSLGKTYSGLTGKNKDDFGSGKPFITYMNIYSDSKININKCGLVKMNEEENQSKAQYGDIFFTTSSETPHEVGISSVLLDKNSTDLYLNSFCFGFRLNNFKTLLPEFARYYFRGQKFRREMTRIAQGASRYNLSKKYFLDTPINIPANIKEQEAIANVLSIADQELKLLSEKLSFLKDQKKYLLNNLVTGNIRIKA